MQFCIIAMSLSIRSYNTVDTFLQDAAVFLRPFSLENNRILGICTALGTAGKNEMPYAIVVLEQMKVRGVFMVFDGVVLIGFRSDDEAIKLAATHLQHSNVQITSAMGTTHEAQQFAAAFDKPIAKERNFLLYGAVDIRKIKVAKGEARFAESGDQAILMQWFELFFHEANLYPPKTKDQIASIKSQQINSRSAMIWMVEGQPVSLAAIIRTTPDIAIIGHVFTPEHARGKGYSASLIYKMCDVFKKRGHGRFGLYVDDENHTAKGVYHRLGFTEVCKCLQIIFS